MKNFFLKVILFGLASFGVFSTSSVFTNQASVASNQFSVGTWPTTPPVVDIKAEDLDGPVLVDKNANITLSWTTTDATTCSASGGWTGVKAVSGSEIINNLETDQEFTLTCTNLAGSASDSVTVNIKNDPLTPPPPPVLKVVINEVYYDVAPPKGTENLNEWIELFNSGNVAANLKNWTLTDNSGNAKTLSAEDLILSPQQFAIIVKNIASFLTYNPETPATTLLIEIPDNNALSNTGDRLILKDENGVVMDEMSYGTDTTILSPAVPDVAEGESVERAPDGTDTDTAADFVTNETPTPGS